MEELIQYFPALTDLQQTQFRHLGELYHQWNEKINVISRKDIDNLYPHHILHSLAIGKFIKFSTGTDVLDLGTGGGLPGIPLAILFPNVNFTLVDGRKKKALVTQEVATALELPNVRVLQARAEELKEKFDFVVCRAVAPIDKLKIWTQHAFKNQEQNAIPNGIIALKGGNPKDELKLLPKHEYTEIVPLKTYFKLPFYDEKYIMYLQG